MVRTLVFHTNNVGSIPTGLNVTNNWYVEQSALIPSKAEDSREVTFARYSFRFMSIIAPLVSDRTLEEKSSPTAKMVSRRPLMKRSYLILSWLSYLGSGNLLNQQKKPARLAILPSRRRKYTLTKAPMAHKTNSKEQFLFKFYNFKFSYSVRVPKNAAPAGFLQGGHVMMLTQRYFPAFETNLLLLKHGRISQPVNTSSSLKCLLS